MAKRVGRKSKAQTPAPPKERIFGSKKNPKGSASSEKSASKIRLNKEIIKGLENKLAKFKEENPNKKNVNLNDLKAVFRRGLGAYSSSHRPTISGGVPNTRNAWAFARVNKFLKKASGEKVKKAYVQDDDLLKMEDGGTTLLAPNGEPSNLTTEQYKLVRTPQFKVWFGDWENDPENASKVVDENGEPLVVYRGVNPKPLAEGFNPPPGSWDYSRQGYQYFAKNRDYSRMFGSTKPFFLNIRDLLDFNYYNDILIKNGIYEEYQDNIEGIFQISDEIEAKRPYLAHIIEVDNEMPELADEIINKLKTADGFHGYEASYYGEEESYVVKNANQIKLADGSNTTFDGSNPDIRFEEGGEVNEKEKYIDEYFKRLEFNRKKLPPKLLRYWTKMASREYEKEKLKQLPYRQFKVTFSIPAGAIYHETISARTFNEAKTEFRKRHGRDIQGNLDKIVSVKLIKDKKFANGGDVPIQKHDIGHGEHYIRIKYGANEIRLTNYDLYIPNEIIDKINAPKEKIYQFNSVYVSPSDRGQGIASKLIKATIDYAKEKEIFLVTLIHSQSNSTLDDTELINWLSRNGFSILYTRNKALTYAYFDGANPDVRFAKGGVVVSKDDVKVPLYHGTTREVWRNSKYETYLFVTYDFDFAKQQAIDRAIGENGTAIVVKIDPNQIKKFIWEVDDDMGIYKHLKTWQDSYNAIGSFAIIGKFNINDFEIIEIEKDYAKGGEVMGTSPTLEGIQNLIGKFYYSSNITLEKMGDIDEYAIKNAKGVIDGVKVVLKKGRYQFVRIMEKGGEVDKKVLRERWAKKKDALENLANNISRLRKNLSKDLKEGNEKENLTALVVKIMDETGERVGNEESANNGHFGVTGLKKKHIKINGSRVKFKYVGKSGVEHEKELNDYTIASALKQAMSQSPSEYVFETSEGFRIKNDRVNRYLNIFNVSAKDLRGYSANKWIINKLKSVKDKEILNNDAKRKKKFNEIVKSVAEKVGHGSATLKKHYLLPSLEREFVNHGKIVDLSNIKRTYKHGGQTDEVNTGVDVIHNIDADPLDELKDIPNDGEGVFVKGGNIENRVKGEITIYSNGSAFVTLKSNYGYKNEVGYADIYYVTIKRYFNKPEQKKIIDALTKKEVNPNSKIRVIEFLEIYENYRGKGYASYLLKEIIEYYKEAGDKYLVLSVGQGSDAPEEGHGKKALSHKALLDFYSRHGFEEILEGHKYMIIDLEKVKFDKGGKLLGKYAFVNDDFDGYKVARRLQSTNENEPANKLEKQLYKDLERWQEDSTNYNANKLYNNKNIFDKLATQYPKIFKPSEKFQYVYRGISNLEYKYVRDIIWQLYNDKIELSDFVKIDDVYFLYTKPFDYKPERNAQSWTKDIDVALSFSRDAMLITKKDDNFIMNYQYYNAINEVQEDELIHLGKEFDNNVYIMFRIQYFVEKFLDLPMDEKASNYLKKLKFAEGGKTQIKEANKELVEKTDTSLLLPTYTIEDVKTYVDDLNREDINDILDKLNMPFNVVDELGSGANGIAWQTNRGTVLKITKSGQEAYSSYIIFKNQENFSSQAEIYNLFVVIDLEDLEKYYFIEKQLLRPARDVMSDELLDLYRDIEMIATSRDSKEQKIDEFNQLINDEDINLDDIDKEYAEQIFELAMKVKEEAKPYGLNLNDNHSGNVGFDWMGKLYCFDCGYVEKKSFLIGGNLNNKLMLTFKDGGEITQEDKKEIYAKWRKLVNMSRSELERFYNSEEGKVAGLTPQEADEQGIDSGRESARWIMKMKSTKVADWTPMMWKWAKKQISFISRMSGNKGKLVDENGAKTRKHLSLLIWGHNPNKKGMGGDVEEPCHVCSMSEGGYNQLPSLTEMADGKRFIYREDVFRKGGDTNTHVGSRYMILECMGEGGITDTLNLKVIQSSDGLLPNTMITRPIRNIINRGREMGERFGKTIVGSYKKGGELNPDDKKVKNYFEHKSGEAGGLLVGKRHSEGGIKATNNSTGQPLEMEGGEVVITRDAVSDSTKRLFEGKYMTNRQILSAINVSGGGVSFAEGGETPELNC